MSRPSFLPNTPPRSRRKTNPCIDYCGDGVNYTSAPVFIMPEMPQYTSPEVRTIELSLEKSILSGTASGSNENYSVEQSFDPFA